MVTSHSSVRAVGVLVALVACLALPTTARADGKAFHSAVPNLSMPDQQAIITWKDGVETLVISTAIDMPTAGAADASAAWVVPLPTQGRVPEIFLVEPGVFDAARAACTPRLARIPEALAPALFALGALAWCMVLVPRHRYLIAAVGAVVLAFFLVLALLPSLGTARSARSPVVEGSGVRILDARRIGAFETTTLSSTDPGELVRWLTDHGFKLTPGIEPVIAAHVAQRWVFVASRLVADPAGPLAGRVEPHPLGFRFPTASPLYPLRLTGVGNSSLAVDLYIFGPGSADAYGFREARSGPVDASPRADIWRPDGVVRVSQPELAALAAGSPWLTRLSGTLTPDDLTSDAGIVFSTGIDRGGVVHSAESAREFGASVAGAVFLFLALVATFARTPSGAGDWRRLGWLVGAVALAGSTGVAFAATRDIVEVRSQRGFRNRNSSYLHEQIAEVLAGYRGAPRSQEELHKAAAEMHSVAPEDFGPRSHEGVGPQQWRIVAPTTPGGTSFYEYRDIYGAPVRVPIR